MSNIIFTGKVNRISGPGNGMITFGDHVIHIGPVSDRAVGEWVRGVLPNSSSQFGYCVSDKYITPEYCEWVIQRFDLEVTLCVKVERVSRHGNAYVRDSRSKKMIVVSPQEDVSAGDIVKIQLRSPQRNQSTIMKADLIGVVEEGQIDDWVEEVKNELPDIEASDVDINIKPDGSYEESIESADTPDQPSTKDPNSADTPDQPSAEDLDRLRDQAKKDSVENVTESVANRTQTTQQYRRSQAVRDYVMARADGVCEGCETDAPFTSKTGDPYLHAHHINELSNGGSDTPDTVIALCPNCHYRVHHGKDGNEYNRALEEKLSEIEG